MMRISFAMGRSSSSQIVDIGCELFSKLQFREIHPNENYRLEILGRHCLLGEKGAATVRDICKKLRNAVSKSETPVYCLRELLQILITAQPFAAVVSLCDDDDGK